MKTIEITVDEDGRVTVETKGFSGGQCREASRFVEEALVLRLTSGAADGPSSTRAGRAAGPPPVELILPAPTPPAPRAPARTTRGA